MQLGNKIKSARKKKDYTQEKLSEMVGISVGYLSAIERGDKLPKLTTFIKLANALQISTDYLLINELYKENMARAETTPLENSFASLSGKDREKLLRILDIFLE